MNKLNKKESNHFEVPEYLSWENMHDGINNKMNALKEKKKNRIAFWPLFSLVFFLMLLSISIFTLREKHIMETPITSPDSNQIQGPQSHKQEQVIVETNVKVKTHLQIKDKELMGKDFRTKKVFTHQANFNESESTQLITPYIDKTQTEPSLQATNDSKVFHPSYAENDQHELKRKENLKASSAKEVLVNFQVKVDIGNIEFLESLPPGVISFSENIDQNLTQLPITLKRSMEIPSKELTQRSKYLEFNSGTIFTSRNFTGNSKSSELLSNASFLSSGLTAQIKFGIYHNDKIDLGIAIAYIDSWYGLDMSYQENHKILDDDVITSINKNTASGMVRETRGSGYIDSIVTHTVLDYNNDKSLGLDFSFAQTFSISQKIKFSPGFGLGISRNIESKALLINDDARLTINRQGSLLTRKYHMTIGTNFSTSYQFIENIDITLRANVRKHLNDWYNLDNSDFRPVQYGFSIGVKYHFD